MFGLNALLNYKDLASKIVRDGTSCYAPCPPMNWRAVTA